MPVFTHTSNVHNQSIFIFGGYSYKTHGPNAVF